MPLTPGLRLGPYEIESPLGAGGMGEVYRARDSRLGRSVAVKLLPERVVQDPAAVERFSREARAASALNHPNIVTIHDIAEEGQARFIVMELVEGRTLRALMGERPTAQRIAEIGAQVARALAVAHAGGIVHRDIKPENIMVRGDGYVKVLDFGLARLAPPDLAASAAETATGTIPGALLGTVRYMSPEQARGEAAGSPTDIFSLGVVLYELATGRHPFAADSQLAVLRAIVAEQPLAPSRLNPEIPRELEVLILQMLEKDPRLRPPAPEVEGSLSRLTAPAAKEPAVIVVPLPRRRTVGREKERAALRCAFASVASGRGALFCVSGEPGIGKTTLVEDFLVELASGNEACSVARGRCSERLAGTDAYLPFLEAMEALLRGEQAQSIGRILKTVAPTWYVQVAPLSVDDSSAERRLLDARAASQERMKRELVAFLEEASRQRPLIFFFDDMHWADVSTVDLLAYIATRLDAMRLLLITTFRPTDLLLAKHPLLQVKHDLQGRGVCREIPLEFLTLEDISKYLALEFPEHRFPEDFPTLIHSRTEGNPLFMVDLLRYLRDRGVIAQEENRWRLARSLPDVQRELPESVRGMIQRKFDRLGAEDGKVLAVASVQGHRFDSAVVARALGASAADIEERLDALERVHALVRRVEEKEFPDSTPALVYSFVHVLYHEALYCSLTPARKAAWSAAVAQALLDLHAGKESEVASELAVLFETARDFARASDYYLVAARRAGRLYASQEAAALSRRAIACAEKLQGQERWSRLVDAAMHMAQVDLTLSRLEDAVDHYGLAERVAAEASNAEARVQALCGSFMALLNLKRVREAREHGERALRLAREAGSEAGVASAEAVLATERMCLGDLVEAEAGLDRAIPVLKEKGMSIAALEATLYRGGLHSWRLEYDEADRITAYTFERARELGFVYHMIASLFFRGMISGNRGRLSEALATLQEATRLAELNGERYFLPRLPNTLGWLHRELRDTEAALRHDLEGVQMAREMGFPEGEANSHVNLAHHCLSVGEPARAFEHLQEAQKLFNQDVWFRWRYNIRLQAELAGYWMAKGDLKLAASHAVASLEAARLPSARKHEAWAHKLLGDIAALEERVADSRREYDEALLILERYSCPVIEWKILAASAALAGRLKDAAARDERLGRARAVVRALADSIHDETRRQKFLSSKEIREF